MFNFKIFPNLASINILDYKSIILTSSLYSNLSLYFYTKYPDRLYES